MLNYVSIAISAAIVCVPFMLELPGGALWLAWCFNVLVAVR